MCGAKLFTPQYSTTTMRYHLNAKHPEVFKKVVTFETDHDAAKSKARKDLTKFFYSVEKKSPKKRLADADEMPGTPGPGTPGTSPKRARRTVSPLHSLPGTPSVFRKVIKHNVRAIPQLKFDMEVTKLVVSSSLSFSFVNSEGFHKFVKYLDPKMTVKNNRTFMRFNIINCYIELLNFLFDKFRIITKYCLLSFERYTNISNHNEVLFVKLRALY